MVNYLSMFFSELIFAFIWPGILAGLILIVVSIFIPSIFATYKIPMQLLGCLLVIFFIFQSGRYSEFRKYKEEIAAANLEIATLTADANKISTEAVIKYVDKIKIVTKIKEIPTTIFVTKEADQKCVIDTTTSDNIKTLLNAAAIGQVPTKK